jgi:hypothetical protein
MFVARVTRWRVLAISLLIIACAGCRSYAYKVPAASTARLPEAAPQRAVSTGGICDIDPSACPKHEALDNAVSARRVEVYAVQQSSGGGSYLSATAPPAPPPPTLPAPGDASGAQAQKEMIDIEARFAVECSNVADATTRFRALARAHDGSLTLDEANAGQDNNEATFEVRIPVAKLEIFLDGLGKIGAIRAREVKAKDVGKEFHDADLLLHGLEAAMKRYEELLKDAKGVPEVLPIEHELDRLRGEIDRVKGDLEWMKDRTARATVRVRLYPSASAADAVFAPEATLYPALRAVSIFDLRGESERYGYAGAGLSLQFKHAFGIAFSRALSIDVDLVRTALTDRPPDSNYAYLGLLGTDFYSDLLGGGRRSFLNPYLGWRTGYAQSAGRGDFALGGILGIDLVKTDAVMLDLHVRALALFGNDLGAHLQVGPILGANAAF